MGKLPQLFSGVVVFSWDEEEGQDEWRGEMGLISEIWLLPHWLQLVANVGVVMADNKRMPFYLLVTAVPNDLCREEHPYSIDSMYGV